MNELMELTDSLDVFLQLAALGCFGFAVCCALVAAWGWFSD